MSNTILSGFLASTASGLATAIGAAMVFLLRSKMSERMEDALMSLAAGIMLCAAVFSLIIPGIDAAQLIGNTLVISTLKVVMGMLGGMLLLSLLNRALPHEHFISGVEGPTTHHMRRLWLFVFAIAIHNIPEGMSVGVGYSSTEGMRGLALVIGIGAQNIPEGFAVAAALMSLQYSAVRAFTVSALTGLIEALGGLLGASMGAFSVQALPFVLGLAGGAMLFIISDEIIPETHSHGNQALATWCLMAGFCVMMLLNASLL